MPDRPECYVNLLVGKLCRLVFLPQLLDDSFQRADQLFERTLC